MQTSLGLHTLQDFWAFLVQQPDSAYELIYGEIVQKMPTELHGKLAALIAHFLLAFILPRNIKAHVGVEVRHEIADDRYNSRLPDVSLRLSDMPPIESGAVPQMPDLAVEIQSPSDDPRQMREKASYYLQKGSRLVWLIFPHDKRVEVCTIDETGNLNIETLAETDTLNGDIVLEGFSLSLKALFDEI